MMMKQPTQKQKLVTKAVELIKGEPTGIHYSDLVRRLQSEAEFSKVPRGAITGAVWDLDSYRPAEIFKPSRGLFQHTSYRLAPAPGLLPLPPVQPVPVLRVSEADFYQPFSEWLVREAEDCTKAIPLGGNRFGDRWGTPDVIGVKQPRANDIVKFPTEVVSAEIKLDATQLITAFGQSCSYSLFSHKSYLVIPRTSAQADVDRLDALCSIFGIGLVLFDNATPNDPKFAVKVRPNRHEPDTFYVNERAKMIANELF
jgi:hypothetical protein